MTALLQAEPRDVRLAAGALDRVADDASFLVRQVRTAEPPCWNAPSHRDYTGQLTDLTRRVERVATAHDEAAEVLRTYVRALEEAQERARYARAEAAEGRQQLAEAVARPGPAQVGPHPAEAQVQVAAQTLADAEEHERAAGAVAAARLRELAERAPAQGWTSKTVRLVEDAGVTAVSNLRDLPGSTFRAVETFWSALPFVNGEREQEEAREALQEASQFWLGWLEMARDVQEGRPGKVAGEVLLGGGLVTRVNRAFPDPERIKRGGYGGFLDGIAEGVLTVDDFAEAWDQAHAAKTLNDRIVRLRETPLPGIEALIAGEVDLVHHEGRGGHTIQKHVGKSPDLLRERIRLESKPGRPVSRSTFPDASTAEVLVRRVLAAHADFLRDFEAGDLDSARLVLPIDEAVGTVMRSDGSLTSGHEVRIIVRKTPEGQVFVYTAWLEEGEAA